MGNENYKIQLVFEALNNANMVFNDLKRQLKDTEVSTKDTGNSISDLFGQMKEHWIGITASVAAFAVTVNKAMDYMELGAKAQQAEASFRQVAAASGENADKIIEDMKRAAAGTVDDSDIMQKAVKGLVQGLSGNQLVNIMEAARLAARVSGQSVSEAYETITDAIANKLPRSLIQYGLVTKQQMKLVNEALSLGITDIDLYAIAMENYGNQTKKFGELADNDAEMMQRHSAAVKELRETIGKLLLPILEDLNKWFKDNQPAITDWKTSFVDALTTIRAEVLRVSMLLDKLGGTLTAAGMLLFGPGAAFGNENSKKQFDKMAAANIAYEARYNENDKALQDLANAANNRREGGSSPSLNGAPPASSTESPDTSATTGLKKLIADAKIKPEMLGPDRSNLKAWQESEALIKKEAEAWRAAQEAALNYKLYLIDVAEQERTMSKAEAVEQRIALYKEMEAVQEETLTKIDRLKDPTAWYTQQTAIKKTEEEILKLNRQLKEQNGTLFDGFKDGFEQYIYDAKTAFQQGVKLAQDAAQTMEQSFSDFFFDIFTGKLKSLSDYLNAFFQSVARAMANMMAQKTAVAIATSIWGGGSSSMTNSTTGAGDLGGAPIGHIGGYIMHAGGLVPRFHIGGLASDERPIIAQTGEGILSRKGMAAFDKLNQGGDLGGGNLNVVVKVENKSSQPVDAKQGNVRYDRQAKEFVVAVVLNDLEYGGPIRGGISGMRP